MQKLSKSPTKNKLHHKIKHAIEKIISCVNLSFKNIKFIYNTHKQEDHLYKIGKRQCADRKYVIISWMSLFFYF